MKRICLNLLTLLMLCPLLATPRVVLRIANPQPATLQHFLLTDADIAGYYPGEYLDLVIAESEVAQYQLEYPQAQVTQTEAGMKANLTGSRDIPGYRNYLTMVNELYQFQAQYPSLVEVSVLGTGWGHIYAEAGMPAYQAFDHQIYAVKLSDNVGLTEDEPAFYFVGTHHAREPISLETCLGILDHLLQGYGFDPEITQMISSSEIWFVPLLNPDGHKIVIDQTDVWWRKNIRDNNNSGTINTGSYGNGLDGIDLNRNYSYMWGNISASDDMNSVTYHGLNPFSEPETQVFRDFLESKQFLAGISYHTYGEYVLFPYGYASSLQGPDAYELNALATSMAATIPKVQNGNYLAMPSYSLYPVSGSLDDWAYGTRGIFAYTIEMATQFIPPAAQVPTIVQNQLTAAKLLLNRKNHKTLTGHVSDAVTGMPLAAKVWVVGLDDYIVPRTQYYAREDYGSYWRFLSAGTHTVKFILPGYLTQTHTVSITSDGATVLNVQMQPSSPVLQGFHVWDYQSNPLPEVQISFPDLDLPTLSTDAMGMASTEGFYPGDYRIVLSKPGYETISMLRSFVGGNAIFRLSNNALLSEDFESGTANWTLSGAWGLTQVNPYSGSYCLTDSPAGNYGINVNSTAWLDIPIDHSQGTNFNLQFWARHNIANDGDHAILAYSTNGTVMNTLHVFAGTQPWTHYSFDFNGLLWENVNIAFRMVTTGSGSGDGIFIDDLKFFGSMNPSEPEFGVCPVAPLSVRSYPNPFGESAVIKLEGLAYAQTAPELAIYNLRGQRIRSFPATLLDTGSITWDGRDEQGVSVANGVYFLRAFSGNRSLATHKILKLQR